MSTLNNIIIHHSGGAGANDFASTRHHTVQTINEYHKQRWAASAATWKAYKSMLGYHAGYNVLYDPKTRTFTQTRMIGEETAAVIGKNFDTFHLCIIGNYNKNRHSTGSVDKVTQEMLTDIVTFLHDLVNGNKRKLKVAFGIKVNLSLARIYPHRKFSRTFCYGSAIPDNYYRDMALKYKPEVSVPKQENAGTDQELIELKERNVILLRLLKMYIAAYNSLRGKPKTSLGGSGIEGWREDPENLGEVFN